MILTHVAARCTRSRVIDSDEARRRENGNQDSILRLRGDDDEFLRDVRNPPDGVVCVMPIAKRVTFNERALHRADIYTCEGMYVPMPCGRYILQSDFITSLDLHHESKVTIPPEFDRAPIRARCIFARLPAYLDDSISSKRARGVEENGVWCGPDVVGLYRKDYDPR